MPTRRTFFSLLALFGVADITLGRAEAAMRRHRCWPPVQPRRAQSDEPLTAGARKADFIQPDYRKWIQVSIGMHRDEVLALLGEPLYRQDNDPWFLEAMGDPGDERNNELCYVWKFGHLEFAQPAMPAGVFDFGLDIHFRTDTVRYIWQPFHGQLSDDGVPTVPISSLPQENSRWSHFPRLLDLRWGPSSGCYPIKYEIEVCLAQGDDFITLSCDTSDVPHFPICFVGMEEGRWRVRAENRLGRSKWSDYRYFRFTI